MVKNKAPAKRQASNKIIKHIFLILSIALAVIMAMKLNESNFLAIYFSKTLLILSLYILFILFTKIKKFKDLRYNYLYSFLAIFIFTISPNTLEGYLSNSIGLFLGELAGFGETDLAFAILLIFILLMIKFLVLLLVLGWTFNKFKKK